jgi:hypothetical protein
VPADAMLIVSEADGKIRDRQPMRLTVDEQVFGGIIAKAERDTRYHVEFANQKSQQHTLTVFDFPALVRSDVIVTPPEYTKLPAKETKNTQKVTALEGSKIAWKIKVNKPLTPPVMRALLPAPPPSSRTSPPPSSSARTRPSSRSHLPPRIPRFSKPF